METSAPIPISLVWLGEPCSEGAHETFPGEVLRELVNAVRISVNFKSHERPVVFGTISRGDFVKAKKLIRKRYRRVIEFDRFH